MIFLNTSIIDDNYKVRLILTYPLLVGTGRLD